MNARACVECEILSFVEIAQLLEISTSHAYRIHDELLEKLRTVLEADPYVKEWICD